MDYGALDAVLPREEGRAVGGGGACIEVGLPIHHLSGAQDANAAGLRRRLAGEGGRTVVPVETDVPRRGFVARHAVG
eukprot:scaffold11696_cov93-Phaeocystis_antarctica.AAC.4